ncbi:MAG: non-specific serine/threonine protein kinase [Thermocaproicibacter melissae]|uniref:serine/threonine protein kinase n=1 Tax=Thermocaproicibacter melissae TaxID=2966552 RepID=UPI003A0FFFD8
MAEVGTVIEGKYEILKQIGKGGMSTVYLAMDKRLNKQWAVKEIRKQGKTKNDEVVINSLIAEANLMKKLDHPALPRIVDIIDNGETIYVVMDYIEGESLDKIINDYGPQPQELVIEWAKQLCDALDYLHSQHPPIIYRDMKPANVMLKPEGNVKVIDFGIAREYKENSLSDTTVLGTRGYAPPEQHGSRQTDARSDIYALGMTMHHLLTGVDPRPADYVYKPIRQWNPELSGGLERIIDKCTALDPDDRYQNCSELMYALEHYEEIDDQYRKKQKKKLATFLIAFGFAVITALGGVGCRFAAKQINSSNYDALLSVADSTDYEKKVASYRQAISIYPYDPRAYEKLLEAYEEQGKFGKAENDEFLALYNANQSGFNPFGRDFAELNYKIGRMYFNYYTNDDGTSSFATRVQKAYSFFKANHENAPSDFAEKDLSDCYYEICTFYRTYILSSANVEEASNESYQKLFASIQRTLNRVKKAGAYDKLTLYHGVLMLLYDQRINLASVHVDESTVQNLLKTVEQGARSCSVQKVQSQKLQSDIINHYEEYAAAIERAYQNTEERK